MTMSVNLIEGNILTPPTRNENTIICHQVNCRAAMGAGSAVRVLPDRFGTSGLSCSTNM